MNNIKAIVNTKSDRMKELKDKVKVAQTAWDEIEKAKNVEKKIREYKNELAWVQVIDIEKVSLSMGARCPVYSLIIFRKWRRAGPDGQGRGPDQGDGEGPEE